MKFRLNLKIAAFFCWGTVFAFAPAIFAWNDPDTSAPGNNVAAPLNIGSINQEKSGNLTVNSGLTITSTGGTGSSFALQANDGTHTGQKFVVGQDGNVGIGTTAPVKGLLLSFNSSNTSPVVGNGLSGGLAGSGLLIQNNSTTDNTYANLDFRAGSSDGRIAYSLSGTNTGNFNFITDSVTGPTSRMVIADDGSVGIGTSSPGATLDVNGTVKISGGTPGAGKVLTSDAGGLASWTSLTGTLPAGSSGQTLRHDGSSWTANSILYNNGTNVGIGSTSPAAKLDVAGTIKISGGSPGSGKVLTSDASGLASWQIPAGAGLSGGGTVNYLGKFTDTDVIGNSQLFDNGTGVGIGTDSPGATLDVNGTVKISGGTPGAGKVLTSDANGLASWTTLSGTLPSGTSGQTIRHDGSSWVANSIIYNNGTNVGIGTASPGAKLDVNGTIKISGGTPGSGKVLTSDANGLASWQTAGSGIDGSGTTNYVSKFTAANTLGNSLIFDNGTNVGIGSTSPAAKLDVAGTIKISGGTPGAGKVLTSDAAGLASWTTPAASGLTGSGTANYISKFTSGAAIGNSQLFDNGTNVGIGTSSPGTKLEVSGQVKITGGSPGTGKVLTSDSAGLASWQTPSGGGNITATTASAIRKGWGYSATHGTTAETFTISYGITYSEVPTFIAQFAGDTNGTGVPSSLTSCTRNNSVADVVKVKSIAASNAVVLLTPQISDFHMCFDWFSVGAYSGADLAEYYKTGDRTIEAGDVVAIDRNSDIKVVKSSDGFDGGAIGVISTAPGQVLGDGYANAGDPDAVLVALAGRVPVKVSLENGIIEKGDYLTASSRSGIAMKATQPGVTIGRALSDFDGTSTTETLPPGQKPTKEDLKLSDKDITLLGQGIGKVMAFMNIDYWEPAGYETSQNQRLENLETVQQYQDEKIRLMEQRLLKLENNP